MARSSQAATPAQLGSLTQRGRPHRRHCRVCELRARHPHLDGAHRRLAGRLHPLPRVRAPHLAAGRRGALGRARALARPQEPLTLRRLRRGRAHARGGRTRPLRCQGRTRAGRRTPRPPHQGVRRPRSRPRPARPRDRAPASARPSCTCVGVAAADGGPGGGRRPRHAPVRPGARRRLRRGRDLPGRRRHRHRARLDRPALLRQRPPRPARRDVHRQPQPGAVQRHQAVPRRRRARSARTPACRDPRPRPEGYRGRRRRPADGPAGDGHRARPARGVRRLPARPRRPRREPSARRRRRRGQRHGRSHRPCRARTGCRSTHHAAVLRARRHLPEPRGQPDRARRTCATCRPRCSRHGADLGLAFDGDADRCFVVDERGRARRPLRRSPR